MTGRATAEAIIIGGGINGAAIAHYLARAGLTDIVIFETATAAAGASSLSAGIIRTYYHNESEARLALLSLATFRNWSEEIGGECGYTPTGFLWIVGPGDVAELKQTVVAQNRLGAQSEVLLPDAIAEMQPHLDTGGIGAAAYESQGGFGSPQQSTEALLASACRMGARLNEGVAVTALHTTNGRMTGVTTSAGSVSAPLVVLAAGAWSAPLAAGVGVNVPFVPTRMTTGTICHETLPVAPMTFIDTVTDTMFRATNEAKVAHVSIRDSHHNTAVDPASGWKGEAIDPAASVAAIRRLAPRIPSLKASPHRAWAGIDGVTSDHLPIIGRAADIEGLFLCMGSNFKGFKVAPAVGRCLAELIVSGQSTLADLTPFALGRFAPGAGLSVPPAYTLANVS